MQGRGISLRSAAQTQTLTSKPQAGGEGKAAATALSLEQLEQGGFMISTALTTLSCRAQELLLVQATSMRCSWCWC